MEHGMEGARIELDSEAQRLFEQFAGMESWKSKEKTGQGADRLVQSLLNEQRRLDAVRILLIELAYWISRYLEVDAFAADESAESKAFQKLSGIITKLTDLSGSLGCVFIRYRGSSTDAQLPNQFDYEVVIGNTAVDGLMAPRVARRNPKIASQLPGHLLDAFTVFANYGVNNIYLELPDNPASYMPTVQLCLRILSAFRKARQTGTPIHVEMDGQRQILPVISDDNMFPDPNLTLLAGINRLSLKSMESLVNKVAKVLQQKEKAVAFGRFADIYNAAMGFPKVRAQLKKPMVELNNIKWLMMDTQDTAVSLEKAYIAQLAMETVGASPQKVAKMIKSVYGDDYTKVNKHLLMERLHLSSDLLTATVKRDPEKKVRKEVLGNLHKRLGQVKDHVIDEVQVSEDTGPSRDAGPAQPDAVHSQIFNMVKFFKGRSATHKKMVGMVHRPTEFKTQDYEILAKDFRIDVADARDLVEKLKGCFGDGGRFKKSEFQVAIQHFHKYEQKLFGFLWHHMKDAILPADRISFLNALQELTARMNQPNRAFKILLKDICSDPETVQFSDNKAVMLANLIVHRPDKALANYEITPEDIVLNRHNLDPVVVQYAAWRIDKEREQFFTKVQTIHKKLSEALCLGATSEKKIPASLLLNLERELYIFLSLVECDAAKAILRSAVSEYGDPGAELYHFKESGAFMGGILQNLRVALRGVGSVGNMGDVAILEAVKGHNEDFQRLKNNRQFRAQARLVSEWADEAIKIIKFRTSQCSRPIRFWPCPRPPGKTTRRRR
jgi:hypothetical protein